MDFSHLTSIALSDVGRKRKSNEDSILQLPEKGVFCVADGMGGAAGGEMASRWTVEAIQRAFQPPSAAIPPKTTLVKMALNEASRKIKAVAEEQGILGIGTTAVVLFFDDYQPDKATILHAGDSRAYRIREGMLERLTRDHSLAASVGVAHDRFLPSLFRGVITKAIGLDTTVDLDETVVHVKTGDTYLLCSDGLTKMLPDSDIQNWIHKAKNDPPEHLAALLVDEANRAGGEDNISIVMVHVGTLPAPIPRPTVVGDEADTADKTETAEAAVAYSAVVPRVGTKAGPVAGPAREAQPQGQPDTTRGEESERPSDTEEVLIGVTPQTEHGMTPPTPVTAPQSAGGEAVLPSASIPALTVQDHIPAVPTDTRPLIPMPSHPIRRYLFVLAALIAILVAAAIGKILFQGHRVLPGSVFGRIKFPATPPTVLSSGAGGILSRVAGEENAAKWKIEWSKACQDSSYAASSLEAYQNAVATLCAQAGLSPPPVLLSSSAKTGHELADAYCIQLFELQQYLFIQMETFVNDRIGEMKIFGDPPMRIVEKLNRFAGLPVHLEKYPFESLQNNIRLVTSWLAEDRQRLIPLEEIRSGPPSVVPRILTQRNELWTALLADIESCGPSIEKWKAAEGDNSLLNNIAALQQVIMKNYKASRSRENAVGWPGKENIPTLDGFFSRMGQYLDQLSSQPSSETR